MLVRYRAAIATAAKQGRIRRLPPALKPMVVGPGQWETGMRPGAQGNWTVAIGEDEHFAVRGPGGRRKG